MSRLRIIAGLLLATAASGLQAQEVTPVSQMERLDRGVVAVRPAWSNFVSWRYLGYDDPSTTFDVLRDGAVVASDLTVTNYTDTGGKQTSIYQVVAKVNGRTVDTSSEVETWNKFLTLQLDRPADGSNSDGAYTYTPNDMSVGDVDGDGQYELFVKWDPSNSKDNSQSGITGNVFIDCYKLDGTKLWRIDLGRNIRAGAHYTQFLVYDFDGDGKAELMCKTAPGSLDGQGNYVNQATDDEKIKAADNTKSWVVSGGRINGGHEYLTVFSGETGAAVSTIAYNPNRNGKSELSEAAGTYNWGAPNGKTDAGAYGNRGERYLAAVAYLYGAGKRPCGVFSRGYYGYAYIWAVEFEGSRLREKWLSTSLDGSKFTLTTYDANGNGTSQTISGMKPTSGSGSGTMFANGNHNLSVGDVDGDGCDEIIWGSAALDNDGSVLYGTGFGHGDAIHLGRMMPDREGYQVFEVHEEKGTYAWDVHDAATGAIIWKGGQSKVDNGRGMAADVIGNRRGYEFWSGYGGFESNPNYVEGSKDADKQPIKNSKPFNAVTGTQVSTAGPSQNFRIYWDGTCYDQLLDGGTANNELPVITKVTTSGVSNVKAFTASEGTPRSCNSTKSTPCLQADILGDWREELIYWDGTDPSKINVYTTSTKTDYRVPTLMHDHIYRMGICWQNTAYNQPPHLGYYLPDYVEGKIDVQPVITGIKSMATVLQENGTKSVYDLQGRQLQGLKPGLNIIREGGRTRKVLR